MAETWCVCGYKPSHCHCPPEKPAPVALTAEMLGEEDREMIAELREGCGMLDHNGWLDDAIAWADRLLNQGEG